MNNYTIRTEEPRDFQATENLTREAFWNVYRPGCTEHYVLHHFRQNPDFIPALSLVLEVEGKIIGHIMYAAAKIECENGGDFPCWTFGPISIHPDFKRKGYGLLLLRHSLEKAREMGIGLVCIEGNLDFYKHAGFCVASKMKIHYSGEPKSAEVPYFLAKELIAGYWQNREGTYFSPKAYFAAEENPEDFASFDSTFPRKEKLGT